MIVLGAAIGVLIGIITGLVALLLLKTAFAGSERDLSSILAVTSESLAIPAFWFAGPWLTGRVLSDLDWSNLLNPT
jgi:hypothetical protein